MGAVKLVTPALALTLLATRMKDDVTRSCNTSSFVRNASCGRRSHASRAVCSAKAIEVGWLAAGGGVAAAFGGGDIVDWAKGAPASRPAIGEECCPAAKGE